MINDTYRMVPRADVLYACDGKWWRKHYDAVRDAIDRNEFVGELWTQDEAAARNYPGIARIVGRSGKGLGREMLHFGGSSGYQVLNLSYLWGARRMILLGYDNKKARDGRSHWFGDHPPDLGQHQPFNLWAGNFPILAADLAREGIEVLNATADTALTCFPRVTLDAIDLMEK